SFREALAKLADRLEERAARGCIRRCHGDLHLRNICLFRDRPRLFDCIEFNDRIATVDRLYDLAFLLMDLWHGGYRAEANFITNRYLDKTGDDEDGFILLPFMMAVRAAVRAHVTATQAMEEPDERERLADLAATYFDLARDLLRDGPAFFIAMGGFSGSGKTSIAEALAAHVGRPPGARIFESDRVRKGLFRVSAETRLGSEAYLPEVSRAVYARLTENARRVAADGGTVIADAVFDRIEGRVRIEAAAVEAGLPFCGVWLDTAPDILRARVRNRKGGPSDATVAVLEDQLKRDIGPLDWRRVDTTRPLAETIRDLVAFCTGRSEA
ncbi:MAG: AAA family ATPase, partial [Rhodobiaceae bacterium]|nr:AAA family ATPase [Rhodobiaceae bacterium]